LRSKDSDWFQQPPSFTSFEAHIMPHKARDAHLYEHPESFTALQTKTLPKNPKSQTLPPQQLTP
jgi:hypothetical protein